MIMDDDYLNSAFIQMFVFDNYDKDKFAKVINSPWIKIYKIRQ